MSVHHNFAEKFIVDPESFSQYHILLLSGHYGKKIQTNTTQVSTEQLGRDTKSHMFTDMIMFTYIITEKYNVQIINGREDPAKGFGIVIVNI